VTKHNYEHRRTHYPQPETADVRTPYWRRVQHHWRFLAVVFLMLACLAVYVMTGNFAWLPHGHAVPMAVPGGN
jgi:hypothetical protein